MNGPIIIGIAGGSGCGKTTFVKKISERLEGYDISIIPQDSYYRDCSQVDEATRKAMNFDHPDAIEFSLLSEHLRQLKRGLAIERPTYDLLTSSRLSETVTVAPHPVIIVEGILVLSVAEMRELIDLKLFMSTDADQRLIRVVKRDIEERGRDVDTVLSRYTKTVRPMHDQYVEPSKQHADIIIPHGGSNPVALALICGYVKDRLSVSQHS